MVWIDGRKYKEALITSVALRFIQSRQPVEHVRTDNSPTTLVEKAGERAFKDYVLDISFNNDALLHEEIYQHLKGLEIIQKKFWLMLPQMSRQFATLTPLDSEGYLWATPTWPVYPHTFLRDGNVDDFSFCVYVNRSAASTDDFTVDQETGIISFLEPQGSSAEVLMRYTWLVEARIAAAAMGDSLDVIWKTGNLSLQCSTSVVDALPVFTDYDVCQDLNPIYAALEYSYEIQATMELEVAWSAALEYNYNIVAVMEVAPPSISLKATISYFDELQAVISDEPTDVSLSATIGYSYEILARLAETSRPRTTATLWADGVAKTSFILRPNTNGTPKVENLEIPESVWQSIIDLESVEVEIAQSYGFELQFDKIAIHTSKHSDGLVATLGYNYSILATMELEDSGQIFFEEQVLGYSYEIATVGLDVVETGGGGDEDEEDDDDVEGPGGA